MKKRRLYIISMVINHMLTEMIFEDPTLAKNRFYEIAREKFGYEKYEFPDTHLYPDFTRKVGLVGWLGGASITDHAKMEVIIDVMAP